MLIDARMVAAVKSWVDAECVMDAGVRIGSTELYERYKAANPSCWFKVRGFVLAVKAIGYPIVHYRTSKGRMFGGIRIK